MGNVFVSNLDKNGQQIKKGNTVRIEGGYFKSDNGLFRAQHAPGDPDWFGHDFSLIKIKRDGTPSAIKYNLGSWPLFVTVNSYEKHCEAKRHNAAHATIEVIN